MLRSPWRAGPAAQADGPVLVSVTDFTARRLLDLPGIARAGYRLRRDWPELEGAVGMWLWTSPLERRTGSVSVWTDEKALRGFVKSPLHVDIMRKYRRRGSIRAMTWPAERSDLAEVWRASRRRLMADTRVEA
ncbi:hypothetical protein HKK74_00215 [Actinomadura alba]|uniref:DUF3291 domain-containing protein n=2 Tax=Actinomadura alba TaxID=406431 RepID=A0ABR7LGG2_9ACTN|nr:hypothetical protein [Actinomadura alba]